MLLAIGFAGVEGDPLYRALGVEVADGRVAAVPAGVAAAGDCVRGADLIVTAIADGRRAAAAVEWSLNQQVAAPRVSSRPSSSPSWATSSHV